MTNRCLRKFVLRVAFGESWPVLSIRMTPARVRLLILMRNDANDRPGRLAALPPRSSMDPALSSTLNRVPADYCPSRALGSDRDHDKVCRDI